MWTEFGSGGLVHFGQFPDLCISGVRCCLRNSSDMVARLARRIPCGGLSYRLRVEDYRFAVPVMNSTVRGLGFWSLRVGKIEIDEFGLGEEGCERSTNCNATNSCAWVKGISVRLPSVVHP